MSIKNLRYWVFTSGERGIHGLDWGIKHASEYFSDRQQLDTEYRALLKEFGLLPSLERPAEEVGLILLRWKGADFIAGFIFAGTDHGDRPNTSSVICVIPSELVGRKSVNELIRDIWAKNNIAEIARKNSQCRPDTLRLEGDSVFTENVPYFKSSVSWPSYYNGWLQIDGKQRELSRVNAVKAPVTQMEIKPPSRGKLKIIVALAAVAMTFSAVKYFVSWNFESNSANPTQEKIPEVSSDVAGSKDQSDEQKPSATLGDNSHKGDKGTGDAGIIELRKKLTEFLADMIGEPKPDERKLIVKIGKWDKEKASLFSELQSKIRKISLEPKKPSDGRSVNVIFSLRRPVSNDIDTVDEVIDEILSQNKEDKH